MAKDDGTTNAMAKKRPMAMVELRLLRCDGGTKLAVNAISQSEQGLTASTVLLSRRNSRQCGLVHNCLIGWRNLSGIRCTIQAAPVFQVNPEDLQKGLDEAAKGDAEDVGMSDAVKPSFPALSAKEMSGGKVAYRRVPVPSHRYTPLKQNWETIFTPIVQHMKLQVRMNTKTRSVELKTSEHTTDSGALQKAADFVRAFILGFDVEDSIALLRMDDLYIDSFQIKDVKDLKGDHLSRAIGRLAGRGGKTKFTIENVTKTRIVVAETNIHILGSFQNIKVARDSICALILGSPPGKVYAKLRSVATRMKERF